MAVLYSPSCSSSSPFPSTNIPKFHVSSFNGRLSIIPTITHKTHLESGQIRQTQLRKKFILQPIKGSRVGSFKFNSPLVASDDHWGMMTALFASGAFGIWSEKTRIGSALSGALVSTLVGLAASNLGLLPTEAPAYTLVLDYLLPLAIPLLLFRADLRRVVRSAGTLLMAFLVGSVATVIGTLVAYMVVPMKSLGQDGWKIAAALMSRHIGGGLSEKKG